MVETIKYPDFLQDLSTYPPAFLHTISARDIFLILGRSWVVSAVVTLVADNDFSNYRIKTGDRNTPVRLFVSSTREFSARIHEGVTITDEGDLLTPVNRKRVVANFPDVSVFQSPTFSDGKVIFSSIAGQTGEKGNEVSLGGTVGDSNWIDWLFLPNTDYIIELQNIGGAPANMSVKIEFAEIAQLEGVE